MLKILDPILGVDNYERSAFQIIGWWEIRRLLYNGIILICGLITLFAIPLFINIKPGEDVEEPLGIIFFAVLCNIGYTFGWIIEIAFAKSSRFAKQLFKIGLLFSVIVTLAPAILHFIFWVSRGFIKADSL